MSSDRASSRQNLHVFLLPRKQATNKKRERRDTPRISYYSGPLRRPGGDIDTPPRPCLTHPFVNEKERGKETIRFKTPFPFGINHKITLLLSLYGCGKKGERWEKESHYFYCLCPADRQRRKKEGKVFFIAIPMGFGKRGKRCPSQR